MDSRIFIYLDALLADFYADISVSRAAASTPVPEYYSYGKLLEYFLLIEYSLRYSDEYSSR